MAAWSAEPKAPTAGIPAPETLRAFDAFASLKESRMDAIAKSPDRFLWADTPEKRDQLRRTGVICEPRQGKGPIKVTRGLIHDWVGATFIPGAKADAVLRLLQDYNRHQELYRDDILKSEILNRSGNDFKIRLRVFKKKIVTVVLDTYYDVHYRPLAGKDWQSRSYSTRIVEVADPGTPKERERPPKDDHGYLWRLDSFWLLRERDGGVYLECEAVSLSRSVPAAFAWLIEPIVRSLPKDALEQTLRTTRTLVMNGKAGTLPSRDAFVTFAAR